MSPLAGAAWLLTAAVLVLEIGQLGLLARSGSAVRRHVQRLPFSGREDTYASPLTPPISVVVPVGSEATDILGTVHAVLTLRYPVFEILVVDDGSDPRTFPALVDAFRLREIPRVVPTEVPVPAPVRSVHAPAGSSPLTVLRTEPGPRAAAVNAGINAAAHPLVCVVDPSLLLDSEALLALAQPFTDDPENVIAAGGGVRAANGSRVDSGRVSEPRMPRHLVSAFVVVEQLRTFLLGRSPWPPTGALALPRALRLLQRDAAVDAGGLDLRGSGEEGELVLRMYRSRRRAGRPHAMAFVTEPMAWALQPQRWGAAVAGRRRWTAEATRTLRRHADLLRSPTQGAAEVLALPAHLGAEVVIPAVELLAGAATLLALLAGALPTGSAVLLLLLVGALAALPSLAAFAIEEMAFPRSRRWDDLVAGVLAAGVAGVGLRHLGLPWRLRGIADGWRAPDPAAGPVEVPREEVRS